MKKQNSARFKGTILVVAIIVIFALFSITLAGCNQDTASLDVQEMAIVEESIMQNVRVSDFDITKVKLTITDSNGQASEIFASAAMLTTESKQALKKAGEQSITLIYQQKSVTFTVNLFSDEAELITVTFNDADNNLIKAVLTTVGGTLTPPAHPTIEDKLADGWLDAEGNVVESLVFTENVTLRANYKSNVTTYTVTFKNHKGETLNTASVEKNALIGTTPTVKTETGIASYVWKLGNTVVDFDSYRVTGDITLNMEVTYVTYKLNFQYRKVDDSLVPLGSVEVQYGSTVDAKTLDKYKKSMKDAGYEWESWDKGLETIGENMTVTAMSKIRTFSVKFLDYKGDVIKTEEVNFGGTATPPATISTKTGFSFTGEWKGTLTNIRDNISVEAVYVPKTYEISVFQVVSGVESFFTVLELEYGEEINANNLDTYISKEGYIIAGIYANYNNGAFDRPVVLPYSVSQTTKFHVKWIDTEVGNVNSFTLSGNTYSLNSYSSTDTIVYIPEKHQGKPVTAIGENVFESKPIIKISFPTGLKTIGSNAFKGSSLSGEIVIPDSVTSIGNNAFENCENITKITLPKSLEFLGMEVFKNCKKLAEVVFPEEFSSEENALHIIPDSSFMGCEALTIFTLPESVTTLGAEAFKDSGVTSMNLDKVVSIGASCFLGSAITSVTKMEAVEMIGSSAFQETDLAGSISLLAISDIGEYAFLGTKLTSITFGSEFSRLPGGILVNCMELKTLAFLTEEEIVQVVGQEDSTILNGLQNIEANAFEGCVSISEITLPLTITTIDTRAFAEMPRLSAIKIDSLHPTYESIDGVLYKKGENNTRSLIVYPMGKVSADYVIAENTTEIAPDAFLEAGVANITIPSSVTKIGRNAFSSLAINTLSFEGASPSDVDGVVFDANLRDVYVVETQKTTFDTSIFASKVSVINQTSGKGIYDSELGIFYAVVNNSVVIFSSDKTRTTFSIPEEIDDKPVREILTEAFANNVLLTDFNCLANLTVLGENIFSGCVELERISFEKINRNAVININNFTDTKWVKNNNLIIVGDRALSYIEPLTEEGIVDTEKAPKELIIPDSVAVLADNLFRNSSLERITLPKNLEQIGSFAFASCSKLIEIVIPSEVSDIGEGLFENCTALKRVTIETSKIDVIPAGTFFACSSLESVNIPSSVRTIDEQAFAGCMKLANISLPMQLETICSQAFKDCVSLITLSIPTSLTVIEDNAFNNCTNLVQIRFWSLTPPREEDISDTAFDLRYAKLYVEKSDVDTQKYPGSTEGKVLTSYKIALEHYATIIFEYTALPEIVFVTGMEAENITISNSQQAYLAEAPVLGEVAGYMFVGWQQDTDADGDGDEYISYPFVIRETTVIYGKWVKLNEGSFENVYNGDGVITDYNTDMEYNVDLGGYVLKSYSANETIVIIPSMFNGKQGLYPVVAIGDNAFNEKNIITEIRFINGGQVKTIGSYAFANLNLITSLILPETLESIGSFAFAYDAAFTNLHIPTSVTEIGIKAFDGDTLLDLTFGEGSKLRNTTIDAFENTLWYTSQKETAEASDNAIEFIIAGELIIDYKGSAKIITIPVEAKALRAGLFKGNVGIITVELHPEVKYIGDECFYGCINLTSVDFGSFQTQLLSSIDYVGKDAFFGTQWQEDSETFIIVGTILIGLGNGIGAAITDIEIPYYVTEIATGVFVKRAVETVVFPSSLRRIQNEAFRDCESLKYLDFPSGLELIGDRAFEGCSAISYVKFNGNRVTKIGSRAFYNCRSLGSDVDLPALALPASLKEMGASAFENCDNLTVVNMPADCALEVLPEKAFYNAKALISVTLGSKLTKIESLAFGVSAENTSSLENITIGNDVGALVSIARDALNATKWYNRIGEESNILIYLGAVFLKYVPIITGESNVEIVLPEGIKFIESKAFSNSQIKSITLPEGLIGIGDEAFSGCASLVEIVIPNSVTTLGVGIFKSCSKLYSVTVGSGIKRLSESMFSDCSKLAKLVLNRKAYESLTIEQSQKIRDGNDAILTTIMQGVTFIGTEIAANTFNNVTIRDNLRIYVEDDLINANARSYFINWSPISPDFFIASKNDGNLPRIDFNVDNGQRISSRNAEYIEVSPVTRKNGYTFIGWYENYSEEEGFTNLVSFPYRVIKQVTLYARWMNNARESIGTDRELGYSYTEVVSGGYYNISSYLAPQGVGSTLYVPAAVDVVEKYPLRGVSSVDSFSAGAVTGIKNIIFVDGDNFNVPIANYFKNFANLEAFTVLNTKSQLVSIDGVLYSKDGKTLVSYPRARKNSDGELAVSYTVLNGVETILPYAFENCGLESIALPASLKTIGDKAFDGCSALISMEFATGSDITMIAEGALDDTQWYLDSIDSDGDVMVIAGGYLYRYFGYSSMVSIPSEVKTIGIKAFENFDASNNPRNNISAINIPASVKRISDNAFIGCAGIESVTFASGSELMSVSPEVFAVTAWYKNNSSQGFIIAGNVLLKYSGSDANVEIPSSVKIIGYRAFYNTYNMTSVVFHSGVEKIEKEAFFGCKDLERLEIPANLTEIGDSAFESCVKLYSVTFATSSKLNIIGKAAFKACMSLASISIPDAVKTLGEHAFENCTALGTVSINSSSSLTKIGQYAFAGASALASIQIPAGIVNIESYVFSNCTNLVNVTFVSENNLKVISSYAFYSCTKLGSSLAGKKNLITLQLPYSLITIGNSAFESCSGLYGVMMNANITDIGERAFANCTKLYNITILAAKVPNMVTSNDSSSSFYNTSEDKRFYVTPTSASESTTILAAYQAMLPGEYREHIFETGTYAKVTYYDGESVYQVNGVDAIYYCEIIESLPTFLKAGTQIGCTFQVNGVQINAPYAVTKDTDIIIHWNNE